MLYTDTVVETFRELLSGRGALCRAWDAARASGAMACARAAPREDVYTTGYSRAVPVPYGGVILTLLYSGVDATHREPHRRAEAEATPTEGGPAGPGKLSGCE